MTQPVTTSACLVRSGVVVPPTMMTFTLVTHLVLGQYRVRQGPRPCPGFRWSCGKVRRRLDAGVAEEEEREGVALERSGECLSGTPRLRPLTSTPMDATFR